MSVNGKPGREIGNAGEGYHALAVLLLRYVGTAEARCELLGKTLFDAVKKNRRWIRDFLQLPTKAPDDTVKSLLKAKGTSRGNPRVLLTPAWHDLKIALNLDDGPSLPPEIFAAAANFLEDPISNPQPPPPWGRPELKSHNPQKESKPLPPDGMPALAKQSAISVAEGAGDAARQPSVRSETVGLLRGEEGRGILYGYSSLLEDRQRDFIGRKYIFDGIDRFISHNKCGYFTVQGDPGMGKTTALVELAKRKELVAHFNIRAMGTAGIMAFQQSMIEQLADRLHVDPRPTPTRDPVTDGQIISSLLQLAAKQKKEPVIFVVDALDEVDPNETSGGQNILLLPSELPHGVFMVLSRRNVPIALRATAPQQVLIMEDHVQANKTDASSYVLKRLEHVKPMLPAEVNVESLASALVEASAGNFMYLRFITDEIAQGGWTSERTSTLPAGLEGYYRDHWRRMGMDKRPPPEDRLRIVYILSELVGQATTQLIARFSGSSPVEVQSVLQDWSQFLHKNGQGPATRYGIYHASFQDFLMRQDIVTAAAISLPALRERMGEVAFGQIFENG